jgi:parallel beta-helix repeat protein
LGTAVTIEGHSRVTVSGIRSRGFSLGLRISDAHGCSIIDCDFSENYDNPDAEWTDGPNYGGILFERVHGSRVANTTARHNWNGLHLRNSNGNTIERNDMSHCSNACLKLWAASRNVIRDSNFSYGIRQRHPGCKEHACDSTGALLETASNHNRVFNNDFTHSGDGVFVRSLNGVVSSGNYFEGNDASFANNNAWECSSPGNTFINNKGNNSSYGFWLGMSDRTVMSGNEAAYNGLEKANAPESFGNAGVAFVNGSASHIIFEENHIHHNTSVGLALGYLDDYPSYHWIIQKNRIHDNAVFGVYMNNVRWVDMAANDITNNGSGAIWAEDGKVHDLFQRWASMEEAAPTLKSIAHPETAIVGQAVTFDATGSIDPGRQRARLAYRWDFGDGTIVTKRKQTHRYGEPGFYRVGVTTNNGRLADLAGFDIYIVDPAEEVATEGDAATNWSVKTENGLGRVVRDGSHVLLGDHSVRLDATAKTAILRYPARRRVEWDLDGVSTLVVWVGFEHEAPDGFEGNGPTVRLVGDSWNIEYRPENNLLGHPSAESPWRNSEARYGWRRLEIPLVDDSPSNSNRWQRHGSDVTDFAGLHALEVEVRTRGGTYQLWLDGLMFVPK